MSGSFFGLDGLDPVPLAEDGVWMTLKHPVTGRVLMPAKVPCRLKLAGPDSDRYREMEREFEKSASDAEGASDQPLTPDARYRLRLNSFLRCVLDWEGFMEEDGETPKPFARAELARLFAMKWPFEQAFAFASSRANFFGSAAATSSGDSETG